MTIREQAEQLEKSILSPLAALSCEAKRESYMEPCSIRTAFCRKAAKSPRSTVSI